MNALVWRLHRNQAYIALAALAALAVVLLITGIAMARNYHGFLASCAVEHDCGDASRLFTGDGVINALVYATMAVPLLFGLFWGAPLLAREFEDGTHNLAWTQGVTRRRWLSSTVMWALLAAAVWGGTMAALISWWRLPENALGIPAHRLAVSIFDIQGIVPVAYSVFAVALGVAAGSMFRRVLPAMATTAGVFTALRFLIAVYARPRYMTPVTGKFPVTIGLTSRAPADSWVLSNALTAPDGQHYGLSQTPAACTGSYGPARQTCLSVHGFHLLVTYQPASRFWEFQGIEAGIFIVLAAALVAVAYRIVLSKDA